MKHNFMKIYRLFSQYSGSYAAISAAQHDSSMT